MKKVISLVLLFTIFLTNFTVLPVNADTNESNTNEVKVLEDLMKDEKFKETYENHMIEQYGENYQNDLAVRNAGIIESRFNKDSSGKRVYPSYIGGLYIDDDDNLVIQIVDSNIPEIKSESYKSYEKVFTVDENAKIEYVTYSYDELTKLRDYLLDNYLGKIDNFSGLYIDEKLNKVVVELMDLSDKKIKEFQDNVLSSSMITFDKGKTFVNAQNINPGNGFKTPSGGGCSFGYRAKNRYDTIGIVTAGHCFSSSGQNVSGVGYVSNYSNDGILDAAFITTDSGVTPTNLIVNPLLGMTTLGTTVEYPLKKGQEVIKYGARTGFSSSSIKEVDYSYTVGGTTYRNLILTELYALDGDSGGIVYHPSSNENTTVGIIKAILINKDTEEFLGETVVAKALLINSTFGLSRY